MIFLSQEQTKGPWGREESCGRQNITKRMRRKKAKARTDNDRECRGKRLKEEGGKKMKEK